jgi:hypothetical protein
MSAFDFRRALAAALAIGLVAGATRPGRAEIEDYEFVLVEEEIKEGPWAVVSARLVHKPTGRLVSDAVVFARRIDMAPEDMEAMTSPLEPLPEEEPGVYRFRTDLSMEGSWRLSLAAKVQGEAGTVESRLVLKAVPR